MDGIVDTIDAKSRRRLVPWAARLFVRMVLGATFVLTLIQLANGVAEVGPTGIVLLAIAAAIVLGRGMRLAAPSIGAALKRIRIRFSLRTLLIMTMIAGLGLAWIGNRVRHVRQQRQLVRTAYDHGFLVGFDDSVAEWAYGRFGMNGALACGDLDIVCKNTPIADGDLEALSGLRFLSLSLNRSNITDDQIVRWTPPRALVSFEAQATGLGDKSAEHLARFEQLEEIDLHGTKISDEGVSHLARLPRLYALGLRKTTITDAAIKDLAKMKQLRVLKVWQTSMTPEGVEELRRALPECIVVTDFDLAAP